ncbi:hypothetical protein LKO27_10925 [Tessaracoccus sp. OS52]|uniref:hypothetical protein n=1 Tax=Tessaracoccus sp. OS52 TaxID=2886691 RepID=UPI001D1049AD|nr:hypothetical protein [Tessaracoccus sp. OS52]MCC2593917.1 hypothetical protein [Tessaracoccus sp. OS52]
MNDNQNWVDPNAPKPEDPRHHDQKTKEQLEKMSEDVRENAEKFGEAARKLAQETGYAVAGFAGLVGEKAKVFYEEQKQEYAQTHPDVDKDPGAKEFLEQLSEKLNRFVDDLTKGFKDMAERGRETVERQSGKGPDTTGAAGAAGAGAADASGPESGSGYWSPEPTPDADPSGPDFEDVNLVEEPASDSVEAGVVDEERHDL